MLKYIITLYIISFCEPTPSKRYSSEMDTRQRVLASYNHLVLVQHYPITAFFVQQVTYGNLNTTSIEFAEYLAKHWTVFESQQWIIYGLWPLDLGDKILTNCVTYLGRHPTYNSNNLNQNLKQSLEKKWPILSLNGTAEKLWEIAYNTYGSCVTANVSFYFTEVMRLLDRYNIKSILDRANIIPDNVYTFTRIFNSIRNTFNKKAYLRCIPSQNIAAEYLLEVQLCFNRRHELMACVHQSYQDMHQCDINGLIMYPKTPTFKL